MKTNEIQYGGSGGEQLDESIICPLCGRAYLRWNIYADHVDDHRSMGKRSRESERAAATSASSIVP